MEVHKYLLVAICLFVLLNNTRAQNLPNPVTQGNNALERLTCDFGPRNLNVGTLQRGGIHWGLDYSTREANPINTTNPGLYGRAYAVEDGAIELPAINTDDGSFVRVGNFKYRHVHVGTIADANGSLIWDYRINDGYRLLIIRSMQNGILTTTNVYVTGNYDDGDEDPTNNNVFYDALTRMQVTIQTNANQGDLIFRARDYAGGGAHLHLERINLHENPLYYLSRTNTHAPTISLNLKYNDNNIARTFPSNIVNGRVIVETEENTTNDHDFDNLRLHVLSNGVIVDSFAWHFTGENQMTYIPLQRGASLTPQFYVRHTVDNEQEMRDSVQEGIYCVRSVHSHDYFKYHFNSLRTVPNSTLARGYKFPDGNYTIRAIGTDVGSPGRSTTRDSIVLLDNFRPYVKKLELLADGNLKYSREWIWNGSALTISPKNNCPCLWGATSETAQIKVYTSEPMQNVSVTITGPYIPGVTDVLSPLDNSRKIWNIVFPNPYIDDKHNWSHGKYQLTVTGNDLAGNPIEGFTSTNDINSFPIRQNNNTWVPAPLAQPDIAHVIHREEVYSVDFSASIAQNSAPFTINFTDLSLDYPLTWSWDFGDGTTSSLQNPSHTFTATGTYNIVQKVSDCDAPLTRNARLILLPFISKVEVVKSGETTPSITYSRSFINGKFTFSTSENLVDPNTELKIRFTASGSLKNIRVTITKEKNKSIFETNNPSRLGTSNCWEVTIPGGILALGINTLSISATDMDNRKLLWEQEPSKYPCMIDNKNDKDTIGITGTDRNYYLYVSSPKDKEIQVSIEKNCSVNTKPKALFVNNSNVNYYIDFGDGSNGSEIKAHTVIGHYYPASQTYKAKLIRDYPANNQVTETRKVKF